MPTLIDVAKEAGVSPATVSRVINNSFLVSDEKKQRVYDALEKVGYVMPVKRNGSSKNGKLLLVISCTNHAALYEGLHQRASELGYTLSYMCMTDYSTTADIINLVQVLEGTGQLSGIFLIDYHREENADFDNLLRRYPVVCIGEAPVAWCNLVSIDDYQAGYDAAQHLLDLGKKRIAIYVTKSPENRGNFETQRIRGYRSALIENGIMPTDELLRYTDFTSDGAVYTTRKMLGMMDELPDGIICLSDSIAAGCIRVLLENGIRVPEDIAVIGSNNEADSEYYTPSISSIDQDFIGMGCEAMQIMHISLESSAQGNHDITGRKIFIPHKLVARESTVGKQPEQE